MATPVSRGLWLAGQDSLEAQGRACLVPVFHLQCQRISWPVCGPWPLLDLVSDSHK